MPPPATLPVPDAAEPSETDAGLPEPKPGEPDDAPGEPVGPSGGPDGPLELPEPVRQRVVALAAEALPHLAADHVPPTLRRVAGFTPGRRARLAATPLAVALDTDDTFRERVAVQVRRSSPELARLLVAGSGLPVADPVEVAALAYLLRPDDWAERVRTSGERVERSVAVRDEKAVRAERERAQRRLDEARDELRRVQDRGREQVAAVKAENTELRHRLAESRQRLTEARREADAATDRAGELAAQVAGAAAAAEAGTRRLRARLAELEEQVAELRRGVRDGRDTTSTRTRLLVETLEGAAQGLRRELALPAVDVLPADTVEAPAPGVASAVDTTGRMLSGDDPVLLDQLLGLPRVHLVVDGYNVTKTGYPSLALDEQRARLVRGLAPVVARTGAEVTVVFDGADLRHPPPVAGPRGVRVRFSRPGVTADELIVQLVAVEPQGRPLVVVSADRAIAAAVVRSGARAVPSVTLLALLARG